MDAPTPLAGMCIKRLYLRSIRKHRHKWLKARRAWFDAGRHGGDDEYVFLQHQRMLLVRAREDARDFWERSRW